MAKRKRLSPANPANFGLQDRETPLSRAPIADVARDAASASALQEVSQELKAARDSGRMVLSLPLSEIRLDHLIRDRVTAEDEAMVALKASLAARGQQAPIEVMALPEGGYGLISGWRRCQALLHLTQERAHDGTVLALLRRPADAPEAYLSMVEENEIRIGLSYFERARIAAKTVEQGVFETPKEALLALFHAASRAKRSKIRSFLSVVAALDGVVAFPHLIGERLGLRLSAALEADEDLSEALRRALEEARPATGEAELSVLADVLSARERSKAPAVPKGASPKPAASPQQVHPNLRITWQAEGEALTLRGPDLTPELRARLLAWLSQHV